MSKIKSHKILIAKMVFKILLVLMSIYLLFCLCVYIWHEAFIKQDIWFDEAYNLEIVYNLFTTFNYKTNNGALFNLDITTGPSVIIPVYIANLAAGIPISIPASQLAIFLLNLMMVVFLTFLLNLFGPRLLSLTFAVSSFILVYYSFSRFSLQMFQVLGEGPALAYILGAIYFITLYEKKYSNIQSLWQYLFIAGVFFGLASNAKLLTTLCIPAIALAFIAVRRKMHCVKELIVIIGGFLFVFLCYELIKLSILENYFNYGKWIWHTMGNVAVGTIKTNGVLARVGKSIEFIHSDLTIYGYFLISIGSIASVLYFVFNKKRYTAVPFFLIYGFGNIVWFCFINLNLWHRYIFFGICSIMIAFLLSIFMIFRDSNYREKVRLYNFGMAIKYILIFAVIFVSMDIPTKTIHYVYKKMLDKNYVEEMKNKLSERKNLLALITAQDVEVYSSSPQDDKVISVFLGKDFKMIDEDIENRKGKLIVVTDSAKKEVIDKCKDIIMDGKYYGLRRF